MDRDSGPDTQAPPQSTAPSSAPTPPPSPAASAPGAQSTETQPTGQPSSPTTPLRLPGAARAALSPSVSADPRVPVWIRRAIMALVAGVAIGIWQDWRLGLTAAAVVIILDTLYQSKAMAPIPAEALATGAQRRTRKQLAKLKSAGFQVLNGRAIPDSDQQIDHLIVGPAGVFAIDSERWDKRLPIRVTAGGPKSSGVLYHGPFSQAERLAHARWEAGQATRLLTERLGRTIKVTPTMVIYGPDIPWGVATLRGVEVLGGDKARKFFRKQNRTRRGAHLTPDEIGEIYAAAQEVLPPIG